MLLLALCGGGLAVLLLSDGPGERGCARGRSCDAECVAPKGDEPRGNALGINIGAPLDYGADRIYADLVKMSRPPYRPGSKSEVNVDAQGWPTEGDFDLIVSESLKDMQGAYTLAFDGQAESVGGSIRWALAYDPKRHRTYGRGLYEKQDAQEPLRIEFRGARRDVRGTPPGLTHLQIMRPLYPGATYSYPLRAVFYDPGANGGEGGLPALVKKFSVVRFLGFTGTNWNQQERWRDRALPGDMSFHRFVGARGYGWEGRGGPWEDVVRFANYTHRDAWINLPVRADDDYVRRVAQLFAFGSDGREPYASHQSRPVYPPLAPGLKLYVEYSNELWNGDFSQSRDVDVLAAAERPDSLLFFDRLLGEKSEDRQLRHARYVAMRAARISLIFRQVFGDVAMMTRVRPILAGQSAWPTGSGGIDAMLGFVFDVMNNGSGDYLPSDRWLWPGTPRRVGAHPPNWYFYGGGGAAYYSPASAKSPEDVLRSGEMDAIRWMAHGQVNDMLVPPVYGVKRVAYEGGPGLDLPKGGDPSGYKLAANMAFRSSHSGKSMTEALVEHHHAWSRRGGDLLVYLASTSGVEWGFAAVTRDRPVGNILDLHSPKIAGVEELNAMRRAPTAVGETIPGQLPGAAWVTCRGGPRAEERFGASGQVLGDVGGALRWCGYLFRSKTAAMRELEVSLAPLSPGTEVRVYLDGALLKSSSANGDRRSFAVGVLPPGLHGVIVEARGGEVRLDAVAVH